jgi:hypothetical protein
MTVPTTQGHRHHSTSTDKNPSFVASLFLLRMSFMKIIKKETRKKIADKFFFLIGIITVREIRPKSTHYEIFLTTTAQKHLHSQDQQHKHFCMLFLEKQIGESIMYQIHRISFRSRFD